jgi:hypothetical protein
MSPFPDDEELSSSDGTVKITQQLLYLLVSWPQKDLTQLHMELLLDQTPRFWEFPQPLLLQVLAGDICLHI